MRTTGPALWQHNPHISPLRDDDPEVERIECQYPLIHGSNQRVGPRVADANHVNRLFRDAYHLVEAPAEEVSGEFIGRQAVRLLAGNRYLPRAHSAADVQLRHFVEDLERGTGNRLSERMDRDQGFDFLLREIADRFSQPLVVETGCVRCAEDWRGAGFSTGVTGRFSATKWRAADLGRS